MDTSELSQREIRLEALLAAGEKAAAMALLLELVGNHAKRHDFAKAEMLRERLYDIDPMALTEIIKAGELIEAEQSRGMDPNKLSAFSALTAALSSEERYLLYYALGDRRLASGEVLCKQGERLERLILVRAGTLLLSFKHRQQPQEIATLEAGDIAGQETVFNASLSTVEIKALHPSAICTLEQSVLAEWRQQQLGLYNKLQHFCRQRQVPFEALAKRHISRRHHPRLELEGAFHFQLVDRQGQRVGKPLRGTLADISTEGLAFAIKSYSWTGVAMLLGRGLWGQFVLSAGRHQGKTMEISGHVVGVIHALFNDYNIHLSFHSPLAADLLAGLKPVGTLPPPT